MTKELEVRLREIGCPYGTDDTRASVWLDGYSKGHTDACTMAALAVERAFEEARKP